MEIRRTMAIRVARRVRPLLPALALGLGIVAVPAIAAAAPGTPSAASVTARPHVHHHHQTIASVQKRLGRLALRNTQLVEKFDQAQTLVHKRDAVAHAAQRHAAAEAASYRRAHSAFEQVVQEQYEDTSFGAAGALLDSNDGSNYLDRLDTLDLVSTHTSQVVAAVASTRSAAQHASATADRMLSAATEQRDHLTSQRRSVGAQINKYRDLLDTLDAAQRAAYVQASDPAVDVSKMHFTAAGTGAARRAVQFALKQVGKPYVFGASGPGSYDCSGLTMAAWGHAGVSLPHSAADQYNYGHHVSRSQLEPGDLLFYYQPIGHVTIYIGDGMMVSAPTEGENVEVIPVSSSNGDYVGATRL